MCRIDPAIPNRGRKVVNRLDRKVFEANQDSHHIEQGVYRPNLMQVYLIGRNTVNPTLSFTDEAKSLTGALLDQSRQRTLLHYRLQLSNRSAMVVMMLLASFPVRNIKVHLGHR